VDLVTIPNTADVITSGVQQIDARLLGPLQAAAAAFRREVGKPVYVREAYRSDAEQERIFLERYYRVQKKTGVFFDGSYWQKRTGFATAAVPGSDAAKHRLGLAVDLWSGIDTSFTSREHLVWVRVAAPHGWVNTGRNFAEPWHQQGTPGVRPAGGTATPFPDATQEDTLSAEDVRQINAHTDDTANNLAEAGVRLLDYQLVKLKGKNEVFLSQGHQTLRWLSTPKTLADVQSELKPLRATFRTPKPADLPIREVDNLAAFGGLIGPRPAGAVYAVL
jgi:hypothetical protein